MTNQRIKLIGLPGTGKTTRLLEYLDKILLEYSPNQIIYCSYSNAAVNEAKERVIDKFNIEEEELNYFKTMHSLCLRLIHQKSGEYNIKIGSKPAKTTDFQMFLTMYLSNKQELLDYLEDLKIFAHTQLYVSPEERDDPLSYYTLGDNPAKFFKSIFNYMYSDFGCTPSTSNNFQDYIKDLQERINLPRKYFKNLYVILLELEEEWKTYMKENDLFEFQQLLYLVFTHKIIPNAKILIVDEYQDSSKLQGQLVDLWSVHMDTTLVAGDPNQAIYGFNGASPEYLENFQADQTEILHQTWRLPGEVVNYSKEILSNHWTTKLSPATDKEGRVLYASWDEINWNSYSNIFILGRTTSILDKAKNELANLGILENTEKGGKVTLMKEIYLMYVKDLDIPVTLLFDINNSFPSTFNPQLKSIFEQMEKEELKVSSGDHYQETKITKDMLNTILGISKATELFQLLNRSLNRNNQILFRKVLEHSSDSSISEFKFSLIDSNVEFMTMHSSKGKEAECVILLTSASWYEIEDRVDENEEARVYFVAATRTKKDLILVTLKEDNLQETRFLPNVS